MKGKNILICFLTVGAAYLSLEFLIDKIESYHPEAKEFKVVYGTMMSNGINSLSCRPVVMVKTKPYGSIPIDIRYGSIGKYHFVKGEKVKVALELDEHNQVKDSWLLDPKETPFNKAPK